MKKIILSIQHLLAMFGATVLVPLLTGFDPSVAIFCAGVGTLLFHKCTDFKVPVFLGSSFAFISAIMMRTFRLSVWDGVWIALFSDKLEEYGGTTIFSVLLENRLLTS